MLTPLLTALLLTAQPANPCTGWQGDEAARADFDACLAGEWGEPGCTDGQTIDRTGYVSPEGEACTFTDIQRDPHTGGFRLAHECGGESDVAVWIVENDQVLIGDSVSGYPPVFHRCEADG